jgi:hypothetical protein
MPIFQPFLLPAQYNAAILSRADSKITILAHPTRHNAIEAGSMIFDPASTVILAIFLSLHQFTTMGFSKPGIPHNSMSKTSTE